MSLIMKGNASNTKQVTTLGIHLRKFRVENEMTLVKVRHSIN
ncbi:hypothetical protein [Shewanella surugensis]|nr:hypothetical protein [Shewanella surugensis]